METESVLACQICNGENQIPIGGGWTLKSEGVRRWVERFIPCQCTITAITTPATGEGE